MSKILFTEKDIDKIKKITMWLE